MSKSIGLYRGKRKDNGEWVEGYYFERKDIQGSIIESIIIVDAYEQITGGQRYLRSDLGYECFRVDPESVAQHTGRFDRNNRGVFEKDILQMYAILADGRCEKVGIAVVLFSVNDQAYVLCNSYNAQDIYDDFGNYGKPEYYEVIGNIIDGPELLEDSR